MKLHEAAYGYSISLCGYNETNNHQQVLVPKGGQFNTVSPSPNQRGRGDRLWYADFDLERVSLPRYDYLRVSTVGSPGRKW